MSLDLMCASHVNLIHGLDSPQHDARGCPDVFEPAVTHIEEFRQRFDGLREGCYAVLGDRMYFSAGASGGAFGIWRGVLALAALNMTLEEVWRSEELAGQPFYELVDMADNEGIIGPVTSKKLATDFDTFAPTIREKVAAYESHLLREGWDLDGWMEKYEAWQSGFQLASHEGFVRFSG
jgi:hypothetical protein